MSSNFISSLEVCGESSVLYTPEWAPADPKLVSLDTENSEEDARIMHNLEVLQNLSIRHEEELLMDTEDSEESEEPVENFLKDIEIFENSFRFSPSSKLFRKDTGETIYITGDQNDPVRFLFYAKPEGVQPEIPLKGEDVLNMRKPIPVTEINKIEMIMQSSYKYKPFSFQAIEKNFPEIDFSLYIIRSGSLNDRPFSFSLPSLLINLSPARSSSFPFSMKGEDYRLAPIELYWEDSTSAFGYSPEGKFFGSKEGYHKVLREMGRLTSEEGKLEPSEFFLKVEEKKEGDDLEGSVKLRISL